MAAGGDNAIRAAVARAERGGHRRPDIADPEPGFSRLVDGAEVFPGQWEADFLGLPPDCPVSVLGVEGDMLHMIDSRGQYAGVTPSSFGQGFIQRLFLDRQNFLYWGWPRHSKKGDVDGWRAEKVRESLYHAGGVRGLFSAKDQIRGRGAWTDGRGRLIYHAGEDLWRSDTLPRAAAEGKRQQSWKATKTGDHDGFFYPARPPIPAPWSEPVTAKDNPAREILLALRRWNWTRGDVDPVLFLGALAAQMLGGALPWRPTVFVTGDKGIGKSSLQKIARALHGKGMIGCADTTAAGIYQRLGQDSLPVSVDELEAEADSKKVLAVTRLARLAASGDFMLRGGSDHVGSEFRCMSCFLFSAINPPPVPAAEQSRMAILRLRPLDAALSAESAPTLDPETTGPRLLRQLFQEWGRFDKAYAAYREVLREAGHDGRGQDTLGVLLACADLALGPELAEELGVPMVEDLRFWGQKLAPTTMVEYEDRNDNWLKCLRLLLTARVDAWKQGNQHTVGALLEQLERTGTGPHGEQLDKANVMLAQAGLRVLLNPEIDRDLRSGWVLAIPNESQLVAALYRDTEFVGAPGASVWKSALRQGPESVICVDPKWNRVRVNGVQMRCTLVRMRAFGEEGW